MRPKPVKVDRVYLLLSLAAVGFFGICAVREPVNYADSDDLTMAAHFGGIAHPPGYPLLVSLLKISMSLLPEVPKALVANATAGVISGVNVGLMYMLVKRWLTGLGYSKWNRSTALITAIGFGLSHTVLTHGTTIEVFPLATMLMLGGMWILLGNGENLGTYFLVGLGVLFHSLLALIWIPFISYLTSRKKLFFLMAGILTGLIFYIPFLFMNPAYDWWGDKTLQGFLDLITRSTYLPGGSQIETYTGTFNLRHSIISLGTLATLLIRDIGLPMVLLAFTGWMSVFVRYRKKMKLLFISWIVSGPLLAMYLKFPVKELTFETEYFWGTALRYRMFYGFQAITFLAAAAGLAWLLAAFKSRIGLIWAFLLISLLWLLPRTNDYFHQRADNFHRVYSRKILESLPRNAVFVVDTDMVFSFLYQQMVERYRPDIVLIPGSFSINSRNEIDWRNRYYLFTHDDNNDFMADAVSYSLNQNKRVFLYSPSSQLLALLGVEGNPFYAVPYGYTLEIVKDQPNQIPAFDYGISVELAENSENDWSDWLKGLKGHIATIHTQLAYYAARAGYENMALSHRDLALKLVTFEKSVNLINQTVEEADERKIRNGTYFSYQKQTVEDYLNQAHKASYTNDPESVQYYLTRAILLEPLNTQIREVLVLYYYQNRNEKMALKEQEKINYLKSQEFSH